jgi:replicative DNA helicase
MKGAARFDYDFIIEKMRRKHSKYRDLKKPVLRSLKRSGSLAEIKMVNLLRHPDYRNVQEQMPARLRADLLKLDNLTVQGIKQLHIARESE